MNSREIVVPRPKEGKRFPSWAKENPTDRYLELDPSQLYPMSLAPIIKHHKEKISQYLLEVARRCIVTYLKELSDGPLNLRITKDNRWCLQNFPPGNIPGTNFTFQTAAIAQQAGASDFRKYYTRIKTNLEKFD